MIIIIILITIFLLLIMLYPTNSQNYFFESKKCNQNCPKLYVPVYDTNGKLYTSQCVFENAKCLNPKLELGQKPSAPDKKCNQNCPKLYVPVYDTNGKLYTSQCVFKNAKCLNPKLELGQKPSAPNNNCNKSCPKLYKPVYDTNGKLYASHCVFENAKCLNPKLELGQKSPTTRFEQGSCGRICPVSYEPVYDTDGHEYINNCYFENAKECVNPKLELGEKPPNPDKKCDPRCPAIFLPVYDTDGKRYGNACRFSYAKCLNPKLELDRNRWCDYATLSEASADEMYCKSVTACNDTDVDKLLPEYCEKKLLDDEQVCVYVNDQKPCYRIYSPEKYDNNNVKMTINEIIQKSQQAPETDIQIYPYLN